MAATSPAECAEQQELVRLRLEHERLKQRVVTAEATIRDPRKSLAPVGTDRASWRERRAFLMALAAEVAPLVGVTAACQAVGVGRASFYRHQRRQDTTSERVRIE